MKAWHYGSSIDRKMEWREVRGPNRILYHLGEKCTPQILFVLILLYGSNDLNRPALGWRWFGRPHTSELIGIHDRMLARVLRLLAFFRVPTRDRDKHGGPRSIWMSQPTHD